MEPWVQLDLQAPLEQLVHPEYPELLVPQAFQVHQAHREAQGPLDQPGNQERLVYLEVQDPMDKLDQLVRLVIQEGSDLLGIQGLQGHLATTGMLGL